MKINPAYIQSYQNMSLPSRVGNAAPAGQQVNNGQKTVQSGSANRIDGAEFSSYLSKAEKKFLVEKFFDAGEARRNETAAPDRTRGSLLDIKA